GATSDVITTLDPTQMPVSQNVTAVPNAAANLGANLNTELDQTNTPNAPAANPTLLGYNLYRDGISTPLAYINNPNTLEYYDFNLNPGVYSYTLKGYYDVSPVAPGHDNSLAIGPVDVTINYGRPLPFYEPWDQGTFTFNSWNKNGNWNMTTGFGNPAPSADFTSQPILTNYTDTLVTVWLSAAAYSCAKIYLDFDYKLVDRNMTGAEFLTVQEFVGGAYKDVAEYTNNGDVNWTSQHFELKSTIGKAFKIRFTAHGANSLDIMHWYLDNIKVYAVCAPAVNLTGEAVAMDAKLDWSPPKCGGSAATGNPLNEGFESGTFPPQFFTQVITNAAYTWEQVDATGLLGVHTGNGAAWVYWDYYEQDEWLIAHDILVTGNLSFWANAFLGSTNGDNYYVKVSTDHGATWTEVFDFTALSGGRQAWTEAYIVDLSAYDGMAIDIAWQFVDGPTNDGLWYATAIDDLYVGAKKIATSGLTHVSNPKMYAADRTSGISSVEHKKMAKTGVVPSVAYDKVYPPMNAKAVLGYDIYRKTPAGTDFVKINSAMVTDTAYTDPALVAGGYKYYVLSVFEECTMASPSDTVTIDVMTGIAPITQNGISIYPNPATDVVNITSDYTITGVEVMNFVGQTVYSNGNVDAKVAKLNVTTFKSGVYFVKVSTTEGVRTVKITVTH
ncbi:MAG: choice-of-anchor J domain-containing protein, partial [Bacteroidetes bacterium]|nr:choice-of-anchor J domain-containing protein [Bacteroidota bacterium]